MSSQTDRHLAPRVARLAAQTSAAALVTFGIVTALKLPEASWGVISALFTVQQSVGATLSGAVGRVAGVALGTILGIACALFIGVSPWQAAIGLVVLAIVMDGLAVPFPSTQFGVVVGSILLLVPEGDPIEQGWQRGITILIGTVVALIVSAFIFPERAHRKTQDHLGGALRRCGDLLATGVARLTGKSEEDLDPIHVDIRGELQGATTMAEQSLHPKLSFWAKAPEPNKLLRATERLWHTLIVIDKAEDGPLPEEPRQQLEPALQGLAETTCSYLQQLSEAVIKGNTAPDQGAVQNCLRVLNDAFEEMRKQGRTDPLPAHEAERVFALSFALRQLAQDLEAIAEVADHPKG